MMIPTGRRSSEAPGEKMDVGGTQPPSPEGEGFQVAARLGLKVPRLAVRTLVDAPRCGRGVFTRANRREPNPKPTAAGGALVDKRPMLKQLA